MSKAKGEAEKIIAKLKKFGPHNALLFVGIVFTLSDFMSEKIRPQLVMEIACLMEQAAIAKEQQLQAAPEEQAAEGEGA